MLSGIPMLTDLSEDLLHHNELIRNKREVNCKFILSAETFDIKDRIIECKQVAKYRIILTINVFQFPLDFRFLLQDTFLNHLVC